MNDYRKLIAKEWPPITNLATAWIANSKRLNRAETEEERERLENEKTEILYKLNRRPESDEKVRRYRSIFSNLASTPAYAETMSHIAISYIERATRFLQTKTDALKAALMAEKLTATIDEATNSKSRWTEHISGKFTFTPDNGGEPTDLPFKQVRPLYSMLMHPKKIEEEEDERTEIIENLLLSRRLDTALDELAKVFRLKGVFEKYKSDYSEAEEVIKQFNAASAETFRMIYDILPDSALDAFIRGFLPVVIKAQKIEPEAKKELRALYPEGTIESSAWLSTAAMTEENQPVGDWDGRAAADGVLTLFGYSKPSEFKYWLEQFENEKEFSEFAGKVFRMAEKAIPDYEHTDRALIRQNIDEAAEKLKAKFVAGKG